MLTSELWVIFVFLFIDFFSFFSLNLRSKMKMIGGINGFNKVIKS